MNTASGFARTVGSVRHCLPQSKVPAQSKTSAKSSGSTFLGHFTTSIGLLVTESRRRIFNRYRPLLRRLFAPLSATADSLLRSEAFGGRVLHSLSYSIARQRRVTAGTLLFAIRYSLAAAVQIHLAAGDKERALRVARIGNLLLRSEIRARTGFAVRAYTEALFYCGRYDTIAREFPAAEPLPGYFLNYFAGAAHLYMLRPETAEYFLQAAAQYSSGRNALAIRQLGRTFLLRNDLARASQCFQRSVEVSPASIMAHQNAAARYDAEHYVPADWEVADAGRLLIYDNYVQLGEDFYGQGRPDEAFRCYQKALDYQDQLRSEFPIRKRFSASSPHTVRLSTRSCRFACSGTNG